MHGLVMCVCVCVCQSVWGVGLNDLLYRNQLEVFRVILCEL